MEFMIFDNTSTTESMLSLAVYTYSVYSTLILSFSMDNYYKFEFKPINLSYLIFP